MEGWSKKEKGLMDNSVVIVGVRGWVELGGYMVMGKNKIKRI